MVQQISRFGFRQHFDLSGSSLGPVQFGSGTKQLQDIGARFEDGQQGAESL
jgi:hypothetical protein